MNIKPENSEIRTQHYMDAEGQSDLKPKEKEIEDYLNSRGFKSDGKITIDFDDFQSTWRWYTKIKELKMSTFKEYLEKTNNKEAINESDELNLEELESDFFGILGQFLSDEQLEYNKKEELAKELIDAVHSWVNENHLI